MIKPDQAEKLGYVKVIDQYQSVSFLSLNLAVIEHATGEIKPTSKVFDFKTVIMSNFAFILRVIIYHIFIVALANQPGILICSLILLESAYIVIIVKNFMILKYLVSIHLFIAKVVQSLFMLIFHFISFAMFLSICPAGKEQPKQSLQNISMWCLLISIGLEYIFLIINVIWIIRTLCLTRKRAKELNSQKKNSNPFVVYKWVNKRLFELDNSILQRDPFADVVHKAENQSELHRKVKKSVKKEQKIHAF